MKKRSLVLGIMLIILLALSTNMFAQNNALDFDGSNDYVEVSADESLNMGGSSFTIEFWVKSSQNISGDVILVEYGTWQEGTYQVTTYGSNHLKVNFYEGTQSCIADNVNWTDGEWHHIAGVLDTDADYLYLYMDGTLIASETEPNTPGSATLPLYIASRGGTTFFSQHQMDEVRIWNTARTQAEIKASMHTELTGSESGLVAYYKLNESSGTTASDETSNSNDGTLNGSMTDSDWVSAPDFDTNYALDFDGSNDYVVVPADASLNMGGSSFTVEFWVKSSQNHSSEVILVEYGTWEEGTYQVVSDNPNHLKVHFYGGTNEFGCYADNVNWTDGQWHHIAGVLDTDAEYLYLYMDGSLIASETETNTPDNVNLPLYIASRGGTTMFSEHQMDEVRIWDDARTVTEIQDNMNTTLTGSESNLVAYYSFNAGRGISLMDATTNNNMGTLNNMTSSSDWVAGYEPPYSGSGTEGDPFQISTTGDLIELSNFPGDWNKYFIQTANIAFNANKQNVDWDGDGSASWDTEDQKGFLPIGNIATKFTGEYNGGGYTIDNLYINRSTTDNIGFFGRTYGATISNLGVTNVNITGQNQVGGLVGFHFSSTVSNSYSTGSVTGSGNNVGGLVGRNYSSTVSNSYSTGSVSGSSDVGGLVGYNENSSTIENSYSTGNVSGSSNVGGLVGFHFSSTVNNSFWDTQTSGQSLSAGGTGKTTAEMQTQSTFTDAGWDFTDIWAMDGVNNDGYAYLQWQTFETPNTAPVADDIEITTDEDVAVAITMTGSDADGDSLTFAVVTVPVNGIYDGTTYTPNTDWFGVDSFTYVANDGTLDSELATVTITVNAAPYTGPIWYISTTGSDTNDGSAENPFATIQHGLNTASEGDTVLVADGTYTENLEVNEQVTIQSENGNSTTTVVASNSNDHVFEVTSNNVTINGFSIYGATGGGRAGICLTSVTNCTIENNRCGWDVTHKNWYGIYMNSSTNCTINNNTTSYSIGEGILLASSGSNTLTSNIANNSDVDGISLNNSSTNTLDDNTANSNTYDGIRLVPSCNNNELNNNTASYNGDSGFNLQVSSDNNLTSNIANNNGLRGFSLSTSSNNNTLTSNTADYNGNGISLDSCSGNDLDSNTVTHNEFGIYLTESSNNTITSNAMNDNDGRWDGDGIMLNNNCSNNLIANNTANDNPGDGIEFYNSSNNTVMGNTLDNSGLGDPGATMRINYYSSYNTIINNTVVNGGHAIVLEESSNYNFVSNNTVTGNSGRGVEFWENASYNTLTGNNISNNGTYGIWLASGNYNTIYLNDIRNNTTSNIYSESTTTTWHSPTTIYYDYNSGTFHKGYLGNYYSDGTHTGSNGIGGIYTIANDNDDDYQLIQTTSNFSLQAWWLHSDNKMYRDDMTKAGGSVTISGGGSNIWIADQAALTDINFSGSDTWTGQLVFTSAPTNGHTFTVEFGSSTNGSDFTAGGPDATITGDGSATVFTFTTDASAFSVTTGKYLALKITSNDAEYSVRTGGAWSYTSSPESSTENTAPIADDIAVTTDEDVAVAITMTGSDADGDSLTFAVVDAPTNGVYEDGVYTPNTGWFGVDSFTYVANDGMIDSEIATVTITVNDVIDELDAPINVAVVIDGNNLTISWDVVANANSYLLYSSSDPYATFPDNWILVDTVTDLTCTIESATEDKMFYCVVASTETEPAAVSKPVIVPGKEKKKFDLK